MNGTPASAAARACCSIASRPSGAMMAEREVAARRRPSSVRLLHRAGVERGDLVVVEVGDDDRLRGVGVGDARTALVDAPGRAAARDTRRRRCRARPSPPARRRACPACRRCCRRSRRTRAAASAPGTTRSACAPGPAGSAPRSGPGTLAIVSKASEPQIRAPWVRRGYGAAVVTTVSGIEEFDRVAAAAGVTRRLRWIWTAARRPASSTPASAEVGRQDHLAHDQAAGAGRSGDIFIAGQPRARRGAVLAARLTDTT